MGSRFIFDKFDRADFKCENRFLKLLPKIVQARHFWYQFQAFLFFFFSKICIQINSRMLISNMTIVLLKFQPKNIQICRFSPKFRYFYFFHENLELKKIQNSDFKYNNIIFNFQSKNTQIRHFSSQIQEFLFCTKLCTQTNSRALVTNMTMYFSNSSLKISK